MLDGGVLEYVLPGGAASFEAVANGHIFGQRPAPEVQPTDEAISKQTIIQRAGYARMGDASFRKSSLNAESPRSDDPVAL
jgi:hypothetical protein